MRDENRSFSQVIGDLMYGDMPSNLPEGDDEGSSDAAETDDEDTREAPDSADPIEESQAEADKLDADPAEDDEADPPVEETEDDEEADPDADAADGEPEDEDGDAESDDPESDIDDEGADQDDDTEASVDLPEGYVFRDGQVFAEIVVDGERTEVPADELRKGYMRQADYSRKTQQVSEYQKQVNQTLEDQRKLIREINAHSGMQEFLSEHPEAYEFLLASPEDTRKIMQNERELKAFTQDYEILAQSPRLADAYLRSGSDASARDQLHQERARKQYRQFAVNLDQAIDHIAGHEQYAEHLGEDDVLKVKEWVMDLGGLSRDQSPEEAMHSLQRLAAMFVTPQGQYDMQLVLDRFNAIKDARTREKEREAAAAAEHNKKVDEELKEQRKRTPSTPKDEGGGAAAEPETAPKRESLTEVLGALTN